MWYLPTRKVRRGVESFKPDVYMYPGTVLYNRLRYNTCEVFAEERDLAAGGLVDQVPLKIQ